MYPLAALLTLLAAAPAGAGVPANPVKEAPAKVLKLTSPAFKHDAGIPARYTCDGANVSPPLAWSGAPEGTKSFVLLMDDPHPVAQNWVHWIVVDIPADADSLEESASDNHMPTGARELANSFGDIGYGGPCPPQGSHTYRFRLYAMNAESTDLETKGRRGDALHELLKGALATALLEGVFP